ncbi:L-alanine exporter [Cohaesibacter sp. ES.047]|uniref:L-alanine exporter AlaE n=1 Tax=Cohaesibacter sp. ES.047 TaxID=1798205 RepID=UPI000BB8C7BF|nr:L-alanine exporter AlaE [Cohaesibacter sp. ES.047]SNY90366.1 L-alanine exporter [Cohaesibacter sp. ES.047]
MKTTITDTLATILFFTVLAGFVELYIAQLSLEQMLITRLIMVPVMVATGRPYGLYRDWCFRKVLPGSEPMRMLIDGLAFISFQVPVYAATLFIAGASIEEALTAIGSAILLMLLVSRPFGLFLELVRRLAGVSAL